MREKVTGRPLRDAWRQPPTLWPQTSPLARVRGTASLQSPRSAARDIETPTRRLRTIEGNICAGKVILIIVIQHGGDRERAGSRLRGGPYHRDQEILGRARPRERPPIVVLGIGERALPGPGQLPIRLGEVQHERPPAGEAILERPRPGTC
jgi:hypothetical protein